MKIFDKTTGNEIDLINRKVNGSNRVNKLACDGNGIIKDIIFGSTSRGIIDHDKIYYKPTFENCEFNYVNFINIDGYTFKNCVFNNCELIDSSNITLDSCSGNHTDIVPSEYNLGNLKGTCTFINCDGFSFVGSCAPDAIVTAKDSPNAAWFLDKMESIKKLREESLRKNEELRKQFKYGYKIVNARILVKLSFPDDAQLVKLDYEKSRASKAYVESIQILNDFGGEGVTNHENGPDTNYEVGQFVYPDSFDEDPNETCGHGIHFCTDINKLKFYGNVTEQELKNIKLN